MTDNSAYIITAAPGRDLAEVLTRNYVTNWNDKCGGDEPEETLVQYTRNLSALIHGDVKWNDLELCIELHMQLREVGSGIHPGIIRNGSGTVDNTNELHDSLFDQLNASLWELLDTAGVKA